MVILKEKEGSEIKMRFSRPMFLYFFFVYVQRDLVYICAYPLRCTFFLS